MILIVLLNSVLSIMQMPEAGRQVIYGGVIILMLLVYGRAERVASISSALLLRTAVPALFASGVSKRAFAIAAAVLHGSP